MAISEQLQNRIANLTGDAMAGMSQMGKGAISNKDREITQQALGLNPISDQRTKEQIDMALEMMGRQANKWKYLKALCLVFQMAHLYQRVWCLA